jgi:NADH-quinone oxidoreductase subunit L
MENILQCFILLPLIGFLLSLLAKERNEKLISGITLFTTGLHLFSLLFFICFWVFNNVGILDIKLFTLYKEDSTEIFIDLFFDKITAVFALIGALTAFLVSVFSKYYLHRESGYKRYFNTLLLFYFAYTLVVFSGNFETLFMGWEFLGITSFMLIGFYRDRYLPVKNSLKTISLYRLSDVCLILALWMSHHLWHENITFIKLNDLDLVTAHIKEHYYYVVFIVLMLVIAASIKSAQFPFSSWLPRAMEGPTTSSAIFYGSLSVHIGVFLLLRTYAYWETILSVKIIVIIIGAVTAIVSSLVAKVQSSVKTQIAYSSISQIGIMFIELALGWHTLVLVHFSGNAFLRAYQLLVSPSILGYMIHDQFFSYTKKISTTRSPFLNKLYNSIYLLSIKEWNMDPFQYKILWSPFKKIGRQLSFLNSKMVLGSLTVVYIIGLFCFMYEEMIPKQIDDNLHLLFAFIGMLLIIKSFSNRANAMMAWFMVIASQFYILLSIAFLNDKYEYFEILIYISGLLGAAITGYYCLKKLKALEKKIDLNDFYGYVYDYPKLGLLFLISCLAFVGLPFTPTFIGVDLMFNHIDKDEYLLIAITSVSFLIIEISVLRIYARLFLGPNKKQNHPVAYKSS